MPMETGAFFGSSDGIGQFDCEIGISSYVLNRTSSNTRAFNPIAPISLDERCGELAIDEQPVFGVPIRRRDFTSDSKIIAPRPAVARHRWRGLRAIRRVVPWTSSTSLKESQYATIQTSEIAMQLTPWFKHLGRFLCVALLLTQHEFSTARPALSMGSHPFA